MSKQLRILHLEDDPDFSELVRSLLQSAGLEAECVLVSNQEAFETALGEQNFDAILADYKLPNYNGIQALSWARLRCPDTPFLLVSGTIGEQAAIDSLKAGASDYVLKLWPERLVPALQRALEASEDRRRRREAETELFRREQYFRALTEHTLDILTILDREGVICYVSPSVNRVLGYEPKEIVGQAAFSLIHPDDLGGVQSAFLEGVAGSSVSVRLEFRVRHRDGSWRYLEAVGESHLDDPGIRGVVVNSRDVSARKAAEEALRSSEMLFHSVWENSVDGMRLTDQNGIIVAVNGAFCSLFGVPRTELEGKPLTVICGPNESRERLLESHRQKFERRITERRVERRVTLRNGTVVTLEETSSIVELRQGPPLVLSLFRDVTAQKRLEEQLRQSQKMEAIGQLAGGVAHDFNNILTVIHGHASLLVSANGLPVPSMRSARQISEAADRAAGLTRQLLTFSRRQIMQPRRLDLNAVVANMTKMLSRILGEDIALHLHYFPHRALVHADNSMMEQVLLNLAVNARDAMPQGGVLTIRIGMFEPDPAYLGHHPEARAGRFVSLTVTDTGCGIPPANLRRIFEPFFTTKDVGKGTGLGLATVYGIVQQHQGWVEASSQLGEGTTFQVFFPHNDQAPAPTEEPQAESQVRGGTETILVVEDEEPVRELVADLLTTFGYKVLTADSGPSALLMWDRSKQNIDLVLTDLIMPGRMNGRELADKLWADRPSLKVIFTSGYSADVVGKDFVLREGLKYLQKPYHPNELASAIRDCLDAQPA